MRRGDIGVRAQTVTPVLAAGLGLARDHGVVLADVLPGSPAARAGLRPGDLVLDARRQADGERPPAAGRPLSPPRRRRRRRSRSSATARPMKVPVAMAERQDPLGGLAGVDRSAAEPGAAAGHSRRDARPGRIAEMLPGAARAIGRRRGLDGRRRDRRARRRTGCRRRRSTRVNRTPVAGLARTARGARYSLTTGDPVVLQLERRGELMYLAFTRRLASRCGAAGRANTVIGTAEDRPLPT